MPKTYIEKRLGKTFEEATKEELLSLIDDLKNKKKYGLVWENQVEEVEEFLKQHYPVLKEVKEREIKTDDEKPTNLLIEGDNLHALNTLLYTHREKVDVIYIDPPYNTGNKDFVYNDRYVDAEDSWRHSKWLSFMEKRLRLAKELLTDDGVIFISIDDNEQAQLKLLCDDVFGEQNFVANLIWNTKREAKGIPPKKMVSVNHEYILAYEKGENFKFRGKKRDVKDGFSNPDNDPRGPWKRQYLQRYGQGFTEKTIVNPETGDVFTFPTPYTQDKLDMWVKEERIIFPVDKKRYPAKKEFFSEYKNPFKPIVTDWGLFSTKTNSEKLKEIFNGRKVFDYTKPIELMKEIISVSSHRNALILDFFAGSGTTGHAVLEQNKEDGGNRQFILVTNNENNIAEEVTYERLKRVIHGYNTPKGKEVDGLGGNLKYYKTDFISKDNYTMEIKMKLAEKSEELLTIKENCFNLHKEDPLYKIFTSSNKALAIYNRTLEVSSLTTLQNELLECPQHEKILYVLSLDDAEELSYELQQLVEAGIQVKPIPKKIKEMYDQALK